MTTASIKELSKSTINRDDGTEAAVRMLALLYERGYALVKQQFEKDKSSNEISFSADFGDMVIDVSEDVTLSASFIDELIYRLDEKEVLGTFVFAIHDDRNYEKFQKVSTNREIEIKVIWQGEKATIKPSEKKTHEDRKIIIRDL
jgi:hypothetical protein